MPEVSRACKRGQGPPSRSAPFPILAVGAAMEKKTSIFDGLSLSPTAPRDPVQFVVLSTWGLLREIEAANASLADVTVCRRERSISILAPAFKADISALGTSVTLSCSCAAGLKSICPYCIGSDFLQSAVSGLTIKDKPLVSNMPLFPSNSGTWCSKAGMIEAIEAIATLSGQTPTTRRGAQKWGGHAPRRGGAHLLASLGFPREHIKAMARHSSSAIDGYLDGADLTYIQRLLPDKLKALSQHKYLATPLKADAACPTWSRVKMARGGKVHECSNSSGTSRCGWPWSASVSRCRDASNEAVSCRRCLRAPAHAQATSSSSGRVSSSSSCTSSSDESADSQP